MSAAGNGLISLANTEFIYEPYPMGVSRPVFEADIYEQMLGKFPPQELFLFKPSHGAKYSLSEINNPDRYHEFVRSHDIWRQFHQEIKSGAFIDGILDTLIDHQIDLGLRQPKVGAIQRLRNNVGLLRRGTLPPPRPRLSARWEFSMLSADGGAVLPHTDAPTKVITLIISMVRPGEWNPEFGGGTDMQRPKDITRNFNHLNEYMDFSEAETIRTIDFQPNQCAVFVKTFNSLHAVQPMTGSGSDVMRKTLTINIERLR